MLNEKQKEVVAFEASCLRVGMLPREIAALSNPYMKAAALLMSECSFRHPDMQRLAFSVRVPEAGAMGEAVYREVKEALKEQTVQRVAAARARRQKHMAMLDGLLAVDFLIDNALALLLTHEQAA